jgi:hypothetical protein
MRPLFLCVILTMSAVARAQTPVSESPPPPVSPAVQFVTACLSQGAALNVTSEFCEGLMVKSRLIQSDALRYLTPLNEKQREKFATSSTAERLDAVEANADIVALVRAVLLEIGTEGLVVPMEGRRLAAAVLADIMKTNCGPYQLDTIMRTVEATLSDQGGDQPRAKVRAVRKQPKTMDAAACLPSGESQSVDAIDNLKKCLSDIFQVITPTSDPVSVTLVLSPNP